jgi:hypothetical protein
VGWSPLKIDHNECDCVGRSPVKVNHFFFKRGRLPKIIRPFSFLLFSLQAYYAKSLLRKNCKEGGNYHNPFLGYSPNVFQSLLKKKAGHGAVVNGTVHVLLPCACRGSEEEDFKNPFPAQLLLLYQPTCPINPALPIPTIPCHHDEGRGRPCPAAATQEPSHVTMPCTWTGYGEPLPRLPINTGEKKNCRGEGFEKRKKGNI